MKRKLVAIVLCILITILMVTSAKAAETLTIYVDDGEANYLAELLVTGENNIDTLMQYLKDNQMIPEETKVNSFEIVEKDGKKIGTLDLSEEYRTAVEHTGTAGERMYIYSVVNTIIKNLKVDAVYLTVDGAVIETGHNIYDWNIEFDDSIIPADEWPANSKMNQEKDTITSSPTPEAQNTNKDTKNQKTTLETDQEEKRANESEQNKDSGKDREKNTVSSFGEKLVEKIRGNIEICFFLGGVILCVTLLKMIHVKKRKKS